LAGGTQDSLPHIASVWLTAEGRLDAARLLEAFLSFWRQHGEPLLGTAPYHEIAPHLVMMAFLHRVANGGGTLDREYAIGRGRMDLLLRLGLDSLAIELKVWRDGQPDPAPEGLRCVSPAADRTRRDRRGRRGGWGARTPGRDRTRWAQSAVFARERDEQLVVAPPHACAAKAATMSRVEGTRGWASPGPTPPAWYAPPRRPLVAKAR